MKVRYKVRPDEVLEGISEFNTYAPAEVLTGDDSAFIRDLDVFIEARQEWVDMPEAFRGKDLIVNNYNSRFFEPQNEEDRGRGYTLD